MPHNSKLQTTREPSVIYLIRYRNSFRVATDQEVAEAEAGHMADVYRWEGWLTDLLDTGSLKVVKERDPLADLAEFLSGDLR